MYWIDDTITNNLIQIITPSPLCNNLEHFAFNMVVWWRELGEVDNECTSHNLSLFAIFLPKIIKLGRNLTKFWQKMLHSYLLTYSSYNSFTL